MIVKRNEMILTRNAQEATSLIDRMKGLLGRTSMKEDEIFLITPCKGIHTFFMKFPIDVIFLDSENKIISILETFPPHRCSSFFFKSRAVMECPVGFVQKWNLKIGDALTIERNSHV